MQNIAILIGNVGNDPELKTLDGGSSVVSFSLATSERFTNKNGEKVENTEWHKIVAWNKLAEIIAQYVKKGQQISIVGKIVTRSWEDGGVKKYSTEIVASDMKMLGGKATISNQVQDAVVVEDDEEQDLPF